MANNYGTQYVTVDNQALIDAFYQDILRYAGTKHVVVLGDSYGQGLGCTHRRKGYFSLLMDAWKQEAGDAGTCIGNNNDEVYGGGYPWKVGETGPDGSTETPVLNTGNPFAAYGQNFWIYNMGTSTECFPWHEIAQAEGNKFALSTGFGVSDQRMYFGTVSGIFDTEYKLKSLPPGLMYDFVLSHDSSAGVGYGGTLQATVDDATTDMVAYTNGGTGVATDYGWVHTVTAPYEARRDVTVNMKATNAGGVMFECLRIRRQATKGIIDYQFCISGYNWLKAVTQGGGTGKTTRQILQAIGYDPTPKSGVYSGATQGLVRPDYVICQIGGNDWALGTAGATTLGRVTTWATAIATIPNVKVIFVGIPNLSSNGSPATGANLKAYEDAIYGKLQQILGNDRVAYIDLNGIWGGDEIFAMANGLLGDNSAPGMWQGHPTDKGALWLAQNVLIATGWYENVTAYKDSADFNDAQKAYLTSLLDARVPALATIDAIAADAHLAVQSQTHYDVDDMTNPRKKTVRDTDNTVLKTLAITPDGTGGSSVKPL